MTPLAQHAAPQTRMLLASDGSTTTLLEALVGEPLRLRLDEVRSARGAEVPQSVRAALDLWHDTPVLVRRSALLTRGGVEVSRNRVVARGPFTDVVGEVLTGPDPIGWTMNGSRTGHSRTVLETGWSSWDDGERSRPCAFKTYVIAEDGCRRIHVWERFNPVLIPTAADPVVGVRRSAPR